MKRIVLAALAIVASACASNPKSAHPGDTVLNGATAQAAAPAPAPAADATPAPGTCNTDAQCGDGQRCAAGRCVAAVSDCSLVRVRFAFDSSQLDSAAMDGLRKDADCISQRKPAALLIEGHCDERGTSQYNVALGARRADAVRKYLADLGVKTKFDTVSFGKELPIAQGENEAAWSQNRRAEMRLPGDKRSDGQAFAGR